MLIVCPACASEYEIPADRVGAAGRQVRCAACRETWFITPGDALAEAPAPETGDDSTLPAPIAASEPDEGPVFDQPMPYAAAEPRPRTRRPGSGTKSRRGPAKPGGRALRALSPALAAGLVLFVFAPLALLGRSTVVRAMPQTAFVFETIGLPVNLRGIALRDVVAFQIPAAGDKAGELVVEGDLVGVGRDRVDVPDLAVAVQDDHDQTLYRWTVPAPRAALENGETARFRARLSTPPAKGRAVALRFADPAAKGEAADHAPAQAH